MINRIILNETSYFGAGCRTVIATEAARRGFKKAFFVTDKDLIKFGVAAEVIKVLDDAKIPYELYSDVKANPTIANVQNGVAFWNHLASQKPRRVTSRNTKEAADTWHGWPLIRP